MPASEITGRPGTRPEGPEPARDERPPDRPAPGAGVSSPPRPDRGPQTAPSSPRSTSASRVKALEPAIAAAAANRETLLKIPHVIDVRAGYKFSGGRITPTPAVVVVVDQKVDGLPQAEQIPPVAGGVVTDVALADPFEQIRARQGTEAALVVPKQPRLLIDELQPAVSEAFEEALPMTTYEPPPDGDLSAVSGAMTITCHVSPDAGWKVLGPFLSATQKEICLGMYDFTAPHIYRTARTLLKNEAISWTQTLGPKESLPGDNDVDSTKADDLTEKQVTAGLKRVGHDRFENAFARVGAGKTFATAYHIKSRFVTRRRSGCRAATGNRRINPTSTSDADADVALVPRFNREWHAVVENAALAKAFQIYLEHDFKTAAAPVDEAAALPVMGPDLLIPVEEFLREEAGASVEVFAPRKFTFTAAQPLTVQPILTPDNYVEIVRKLLRKKPQHRLYFQNQSLNPVLDPTPEFEEMMQLLADYSQDASIDVQLIFRNIGPVRKKLESLQAAGFNMQRVRMQAGCHTKGIIIDSKTILLGSHNFTNQGVNVNRDASLLIVNEEIANYYERVFLHDWDRLAKETIREEATPIAVTGAGEEAAADRENYVRVPWSYIEED